MTTTLTKVVQIVATVVIWSFITLCFYNEIQRFRFFKHERKYQASRAA